MEHILWKDEYKVNEPVIDAQHAQLFRKVEALLDLLDSVDDLSEKICEIDELINYLVVYTLFHFGAEENYQRKVNYVDYEKHKKIHEDFSKKISEHKRSLEQNLTREGVMEFGYFLVNWLIRHIGKCDKCIQSNKPLSDV